MEYNTKETCNNNNHNDKNNSKTNINKKYSENIYFAVRLQKKREKLIIHDNSKGDDADNK